MLIFLISLVGLIARLLCGFNLVDIMIYVVAIMMHVVAIWLLYGCYVVAIWLLCVAM